MHRIKDHESWKRLWSSSTPISLKVTLASTATPTNSTVSIWTYSHRKLIPSQGSHLGVILIVRKFFFNIESKISLHVISSVCSYIFALGSLINSLFHMTFQYQELLFPTLPVPGLLSWVFSSTNWKSSLSQLFHV